MIAIGINNLISGGNTAEETAAGIITLTDEACKEFPNSRIILLGILPSGKEKQSEIRKKCDRIHEILGAQKFGRAEYINPSKWFLDTNGDIRYGLYSGDYIHLTPEGYKVWAEKIAECIRR